MSPNPSGEDTGVQINESSNVDLTELNNQPSDGIVSANATKSLERGGGEKECHQTGVS